MSERATWHHSPDAPPEHFCEDCDSMLRQHAEMAAKIEQLLEGHEHEWVDNADWSGGPSEYPIRQCVRCNVVAGGTT